MRNAFLSLTLALCCTPALAQETPIPAADTALRTFAIEIRTGPKWDSEKPPQEQAHLREHSANLKRLRDEGRLVMGARYGDKGLVIVTAHDLEEARALMAADPSIGAQVFAFQAYPFNVFYPGDIKAAARQ